MEATHRDRWWVGLLAAASLWSLGCSGTEPAGQATVVPSASPYAVLPPATIVAKAPPPTPPPTLTPRPSPTPEAERVTYRIVAGDNPGAIAARFDIAVAELLKVNNITDASTLQIGQTLVIPVTPTPGAAAAATGTATPRATSTATATATRPAGSDTYTVKSGDNASDIASKYAVSVAELAKLNSTSEAALRNLQIGQQLLVPATPSSTPTPAATPTGTATPAASAGATPSATATPTASTEFYVVKAGDTALDIAALFGVTMAQLAAANNTTTAALGSLQIGQRLVIPTRGVG